MIETIEKEEALLSSHPAKYSLLALNPLSPHDAL